MTTSAVPPAPNARDDRLALAVIALALVFHVAYSGLLALSPQEAYYWEWSRRLDLSYFDHPPLVAWTIRLPTRAGPSSPSRRSRSGVATMW